MGLGLLSIYLNLKWKQNDFLKHIVIIYEMVKCKLPGDTVTQTARAARKFFFGAPKTHFDPGKTLYVSKSHPHKSPTTQAFPSRTLPRASHCPCQPCPLPLAQCILLPSLPR